jgi:cysteine desulfurase/selenocysteine lyase
MTTVNANNTTAAARFDVDAIRADFAALDQQVAGRPLIYMDNAATSQKPRPVIDTIDDYYRRYNANVHRGAHRLSVLSTEAFEHARQSVARFFHVGDDRLVVFTRGTTDAINLVATSYGSMALEPGDNVLLTGMEHHSNIVPWQLACERAGADLRVLPVTDRGELDMDQLDRLIDRRTRLVAAVHVSNALGTINPVERLVEAGHAVGAVVLVDGAQAVPHTPVDLNALGADFYAFSAHKALGPTGIGALVGRAELLQRMPPYQGGGEMIESVSFEKTTFADAPARFEAGTPHIAGAIGMGAALDYLAGLDRAGVERHEQQLLARATERLGAIPGLRLIGTAERKTCVLSFVVDSIGAYDLGNLLDGRGIAVRTGHHCTQPLMERYGVPATCRASMALYNTTGEVDALADALEQIVASFGEKARAATAAPASEPAGADVRFPAAAADCPDEAAEQVLEVPRRLGAALPVSA